MIPLENHEQKVLTIILHKLKKEKKIIDFFAVPNENVFSFLGRTLAARIEKLLKLMGKNKGASDMVVILKDKVLFIELKRRVKSKSKKSKEQIEFINNINTSNVCGGAFCYGYVEACKYLENYIKFDYREYIENAGN